MAAVAKKRKVDTKPVCKYGSKCYRRNQQHLQNYRHPGRDDDDVEDEDKSEKRKDSQNEKGQRKTINDYFGAASKAHSVSDSGSDEEDTEPTRKRKTPNKGGQSSSSAKEGEREDETEAPSSRDDEKEVSDDDGVDVDTPPPSPEDVRENVKKKFLVEMPEDFYQFWDFCKSFQPSDPLSALEKTLNLRLVGPFDILAGRHKNVHKNKHGRRPNFLLHYRFFYDPPEFQTVVISTEDGNFHLGYYRDDPKEAPVFVASNSPEKVPKDKLSPCGDNIFAAVHIYATSLMKSNSGDKRKSIEGMIHSIEDTARKHNLPLAAKSNSMKARRKKVVCPTFHGAGIVVPVDDNNVGYRPVPETAADLRAMLRIISESNSESLRDESFENLQELITFVQFANDECDYGEGLELGLDLFSFGAKVFHPQIASLLPLAYQLLNRPEFSEIIEAHLKRRRPLTESVDELAV